MFYMSLISIFFFFLLLQEFSSSQQSKTNYVYIYYIFIILVALAVGLRGNQDEYSKIYFLSDGFSSFFIDRDLRKELLFELVMSFYREFSISAQFLYLTFSSVAVIIYGLYFRKFTSKYYLAFLFYLSLQIYNREFSALRLGFASALVLPMIYYIQEKKYTKFSVIYLTSLLVHSVSILSIFLIFLNRKINPINILFMIIFSFVIYLSGTVLYIMEFFEELNYLPHIISSYINTSTYAYDTKLINARLFLHLFLLLCFLFLSNKYENKINKGKSYVNLIVNSYALSLILMITFSNYAIFSFRFAAHFSSVEAIFVTYFIWFFKQKKFVTIALSIILVLISYLNYLVFPKLTPYKLFLSDHCDCLTTWCGRCI
jgi:hypothetical protein